MWSGGRSGAEVMSSPTVYTSGATRRSAPSHKIRHEYSLFERILFCGTLFIAALIAQSPAEGIESDFVLRINSDFTPLKVLPLMPNPLEDRDYTVSEIQSSLGPEQLEAIERYRSDVTRFERIQNLAMKREESMSARQTQAFFSWDEAYKLTSALRGKDLSESKLTLLSAAILGIVNAAVECRNRISPL